MKQNYTYKAKGFTLIELIIVLAIIGVLTSVLVPSVTSLIKKAQVEAAISDARTIKTTVETSLLERFEFGPDAAENIGGAFNKTLYLSQEKDKTKRKTMSVGAFSSYSWNEYKNGKKPTSASQKVDTAIAAGLDARFSEDWSAGKTACNPLKYNTSTKNCAKYLSDNQTNFGLIVVYDTSFNVRFLQIYRRGILVSYIDGEYIANTKKDACFVGEDVWNTIYTDAGKESNEAARKVSIKNGQVRDDGKEGGWF